MRPRKHLNLHRLRRRPRPETECELCRLAEGGWREKVAYYRRHYFPTTAEQIQDMYSSYSGLVLAAMGGHRETEYDRHKRAYIETGDYEELVRMARHVK